jgi:hypothetical protein
MMPLRCRIAHIVAMRAKKQMRWIATTSIVAPVKNK